MVKVPEYPDIALDDVRKSTVEWEENYSLHGRYFDAPEIVNIAEFEGLKYFEIDHLKAFYERVKDAPYNFVSELSTVVYKRLWPDEKSTNIDDEFKSIDGQEIEF